MFTISLSTAVVGFLVVTVALVLVVWVFSGRQRRIERVTKKTEDHVWKCPICGHVYLETRLDGFSKCPQCGSMNANEESEKVSLKRRRKRPEP